MLLRKNLMLALAILGGIVLAGCGGGENSEVSKAITISGTLGLSQGFQKTNMFGISRQSVSLADLSVYCVTFSIPPAAGTGAVGSTGAFSVSLDAANSAFGCFVMNGSTKVADMVFEDQTEKDMSGNSSSTDKVNLAKSASLGTITLDLESKKAVVNVAQISDSLSTSTGTSSVPFDFSGSWMISAVNDFTLPSGYDALCASGTPNCNGPQDQMPVYVRRTVGKEFTPDSTCQIAVTNRTFNPETDTCNGTTGTGTRYAIEIWASPKAFASCAGTSTPKMGILFQEAKAFGRIDLTDSGRGDAKFTWSVPAGKTAVDASKWKFAQATSTWSVSDCSMGVAPGFRDAWRCFDDSANKYQASVFFGCYDANGVRYQLSNSEQSTFWSGGSNAATCPNGFTAPTGYTCNAHTNTVNSKNITCYDVSGAFNMVGSTPAPGDTSAGSGITISAILAANGPCSDLTSVINSASGDKKKRLQIAQLRCYADYYHQSVTEQTLRDENACYKRVELNWEATEPSDFVRENGVKGAVNQFVIELLRYTDNDTATFRQEEDRNEGVEVNGKWQPCAVVEKFTMTLKRISDTKILGDMQMDTVLKDTNPTCVAAASAGKLRVGESKTMFYLNKQ